MSAARPASDTPATSRSLREFARRTFAYPRLYARALADRRRVRASGELSPREALTLARSLGLGPTQADEEILWLLGLLREDPPRTVVEIGTDEGGTLFLWTRVATDDALLVALDIRPLGVLGRRSAWAYLRRSFARGGQRVELLMPTDSHAQSTLDRLLGTLGGRPVDFLFIDGDHSYEGVKRDFEMYAPLVRPGGLVALHDVVTDREPDVVRFWNDLKQTHETDEHVTSIGEQYGIGIYRVPPAQ